SRSRGPAARRHPRDLTRGHCGPREALRPATVLLRARVTGRIGRGVVGGAGVAAVLGGVSALVARGARTLDLDIGRSVRPLGPVSWQIEASPEVVFEVIAAPYLERTPRALEHKLRVVERGADMVLAEHFTQVGRLVASTLETVRFERPHRVSF